MSDPADLPLLTHPADGIPPVLATVADLASATSALAGGSGPLGIDTERAQSFRYSAKAYLIQLRRQDAGTFLLDPIAFEDGDVADLSGLAAALADTEWILHAATQDLPCLAMVKLVPRTLFDTELAARLLGYPRVGLSTLIEHHFGLRLLKAHSAADWSQRPLPDDWLAYAALDVELLPELRDLLASELEAQGKDEWARQEFEYLVAHAADVTVRPDPWRRTSGSHVVRNPTGLALVRELWTSRDEIARRLDRAPGKILPDKAISDLAALVHPSTGAFPTRRNLRDMPLFRRRNAARFEANWLAAIERVAALPRHELPPMKLKSTEPPNPRSWEGRHPEAFARWGRLRPATIALAEAHTVPVENLITPDHLRRLAFKPPRQSDEEQVDAFLTELGARPWQRALVVPVVTPLLLSADA